MSGVFTLSGQVAAVRKNDNAVLATVFIRGLKVPAKDLKEAIESAKKRVKAELVIWKKDKKVAIREVKPIGETRKMK